MIEVAVKSAAEYDRSDQTDPSPVKPAPGSLFGIDAEFANCLFYGVLRRYLLIGERLQRIRKIAFPPFYQKMFRV